MAGRIRDPSRTIPRAAWISGLAVCAFYVGGTLAVLALMFRAGEHYLGVMQAAQAAGHDWAGGASLADRASHSGRFRPARSVPG